VISNLVLPLYFTEGEKKAAKAVQEGLTCIGLGGLWNWVEKATGEGIEELGTIAWPDREAIIVPDSDIWTRPDLQKAVYAFGKELEKRGARVSIIVIPQARDTKIGLDDFLIKNSREKFESLKRLSVKHPSLKQHHEWWKGWLQKKKPKPAALVKPAAIELIENVSLIQVHAAQQEISSSPHSSDFLELALATAVSLRFFDQGGALIWLLGVGAPSSDKTETILGLRQMPNSYFLDALTENSFVSGFINPDGTPASDLLSELKGKCFLIKDLTTLFSLKEDVLKRVLGDLQSIYDGFYARFTGTRGKVEYETCLSIVGCVTPLALARHHRYISEMGSRFLFYRLVPLNDQQRKDGFEIIWGSDRKKRVEDFRNLASFYAQSLSTVPVPQIGITDNKQSEINRLATLLARGRGVIRSAQSNSVNDEGESVSSIEIEETQIEEPYRAVLQLRTLALALAFIHNRDSVSDHETELLRRVVLSTMPLDRASVLALYQDPDELTVDGNLTVKLCSAGIEKKDGRARQLLIELTRLKILKYCGRGEEGNEYCPIPEFNELMRNPTGPLDHILDLSMRQPVTSAREEGCIKHTPGVPNSLEHDGESQEP
jgi:hypothetical protein